MKNLSIRAKTILGVGFIEILMLGLLLVLMNGFIKSTNYEALELRAKTTTQLFAQMVTDSVMSFDLATLESSADELLKSEAIAYVHIVDAKNRTLVSAGNHEPSPLDLTVETMQGSIFDAAEVIAFNGSPFATVKIGFEVGPVLAVIKTAEQWGIGVAVIELLLVALFSLLLGHYLTRKLDLLKESATRIADGDLTKTIDVVGNDEVDRVARAFEWMRLSLLNAQNMLLSAKHSLESEVEHRTKELSHAKSLAEETLARESEVFAIIGHEIRTPLAVIKMMIDQQGSKADIKQISEQVNHTLSLVEDMSLVARIGGRRESEMVTVDLEQQFKLIVTPFVSMAAEAGIELTYKSDCPVNSNTRLPLKGLRQSLTNLIKNAILHSDGEHIEVSLSLDPCGDNKADLCIEVVDDGVGIPVAQRESMFAPFKRGLSKNDGTGIGLSVSRQLIEHCGGSLTSESRLDGVSGGRFVIRCRIELISTVSEAQSTEMGNPLKGLRVLVAEDNPTLQLLTKSVLQKREATVDVAADGIEAINYFNTTSYDLVLTDFMMPNMNGCELAQALRSNGFSGPIIGVTAATVGQEREDLIEYGVDAALSKPLNLEELNKALTEFSNKAATGDI
ncbi:response regulator [Marinobacterium sp. LSUCC0821]|uniref:response regulator n=1 Tax=Marinobacterium sp. LSUCC0821 TaxID=2668067 RepID=UPI0014529D4E|nr:response regulator [Marinobacterium sp. LSUCC0821]QJD70822.1 response regulator [Marinobacterium sp. LSUCC0821]